MAQNGAENGTTALSAAPHPAPTPGREALAMTQEEESRLKQAENDIEILWILVGEAFKDSKDNATRIASLDAQQRAAEAVDIRRRYSSRD